MKSLEGKGDFERFISPIYMSFFSLGEVEAGRTEKNRASDRKMMMNQSERNEKRKTTRGKRRRKEEEERRWVGVVVEEDICVCSVCWWL